MAVLTYLGYIIWPIIKLAQLLIIILWPFWRLLQVLLLPFIYTTQFVSAALYYPIHLLGKFEALYIYLSVASVVGIASGAVLYFSFTFLVSILQLERAPEDVIDRKGRTVASYRAAKRRKKFEELDPVELAARRLGMGVAVNGHAQAFKDSGISGMSDRSPTGIFPQTIMEEEDSDL